MTAVETHDDEVPRRRGMSLARGPAALLGVASLALGVLGFIFASRDFTTDAPHGTVNGATFIGIEGNGWTWALFCVAGLLLLLGSPAHWGAKSMAFIVGVAFVVGALIALSDGTDILGIFATNNWTKLVMGAAGVVLILLSMAPRVGGRRRERATSDEPRRFRRTEPADRERGPEREPATTGGRATADERGVTDRRATADERGVTDRRSTADEPAATDRRATTDEPAPTDRRAATDEPATASNGPVDDSRR